MRIFFTRHGESQANVERVISNRDLPHPLTKLGRTQSAVLADQLVTENIVAIYASPILRAQQTAQIVVERLGASVLTANALRECDCGMMEGRGDEEAWAAHDAMIEAWAAADYAHRIPGGECFYDMQARFVPFVNQLIEQHAHSEDNLLLVAHGTLLSHMLPLVLCNVDRVFMGRHSMRNCVCISATIQEGQLVCSTWDQTVIAEC